MNPLLAAIFVTAITHSGLGAPNKPPDVHVVSPATLCDIVNREEGCGVKGVQLADTILLSSVLDMNNTMDRSIVAHEFVHYLQWTRKGRAKSCTERADREEDAYKVQASILSDDDVHFIRPGRMTCAM